METYIKSHKIDTRENIYIYNYMYYIFITRFSVYGVKYDFCINIGSEMNFHFIRYLWNELCVLYPRAFGEGI